MRKAKTASEVTPNEQKMLSFKTKLSFYKKLKLFLLINPAIILVVTRRHKENSFEIFNSKFLSWKLIANCQKSVSFFQIKIEKYLDANYCF